MLFPFWRPRCFQHEYIRRIIGMFYGSISSWPQFALILLRGSTILWSLIFVVHGITPFDSLVEQLLSGGDFSHQCSISSRGRIYLLKQYFNTLSLAFQSCMGIAFVPAVRHFFLHVNMAFLAPLSWMLVMHSLCIQAPSTASTSPSTYIVSS